MFWLAHLSGHILLSFVIWFLNRKHYLARGTVIKASSWKWLKKHWKRLLWKSISILPRSLVEKKLFWQSIFLPLFHLIMHIDVYPGTSGHCFTSDFKWLMHLPYPMSPILHTPARFVFSDPVKLFLNMHFWSKSTWCGVKKARPLKTVYNFRVKWEPCASPFTNKMTMPTSPTQIMMHMHISWGNLYFKCKINDLRHCSLHNQHGICLEHHKNGEKHPTSTQSWICFFKWHHLNYSSS